MPLKKVERGQSVGGSLTAEFINKTIDLINRSMQSGPRVVVPDDPGVPVLNNSGGDLTELRNVLAVDKVIIEPTDNEGEFYNNWSIRGVKPDTDDARHSNNFVVTRGPIPVGKIGRADIVGVVPVKIDMQDADDRFVDIKDGSTSELISGSSGSQIVYVGAGTGIRTGLVRLGAGSAAAGGLVRISARVTGTFGEGDPQVAGTFTRYLIPWVQSGQSGPGGFNFGDPINLHNYGGILKACPATR